MPAESATNVLTTPARSVRATWLYTLGSIMFFYGFLDLIAALTLFETGLDTLRYSTGGVAAPATLALIVLVVVSSATQLVYCRFLRVGRGGGLPNPWWTVALVAPAAAAWLLGVFTADGSAPDDPLAAAVPLWAAATLVAALLPKSPGRLVLLAGLIALIAHPLLAAKLAAEPLELGESSTVWMIGLFSAMLPFMLLTSLWWWEVVVQLDRNRRTAAELAVTQERLRFASDLHDIQGHHLQVISLKSELAERLLERDPAAARELVHETRMIAKEALEETRSLVAGYRQVAFDDELENAREVLTASGAECELRLGALPADASAQRALASVVREATTNILRHSTAATVTIALATIGGRCALRIVNDGVPATDASAAAIARSGARAEGSGLAGLRERLAAVGGTIETHADASAGTFELIATVPVSAPVTTPVRTRASA